MGDAALAMQLGVDGVFVGSGIFKSSEPEKRARAIVKAVTHFNDPKMLAEVSENIGEAMTGINCDDLAGVGLRAKVAICLLNMPRRRQGLRATVHLRSKEQLF